MAFSACNFIYDGIPSEEFEMRLFNIGDNSTSEGSLSTSVELIEDRIQRMPSPIVYGSKQNEPLKFNITFGCEKPIDRLIFNDLSNWLCTGGYKWLEILQEDLSEVRYKCYMTNLKATYIADIPHAITAEVVCDCPFAYSYPQTISENIGGYGVITVVNYSAYDGYVYPIITVVPSNTTATIKIINKSDADRICQLDGLKSVNNEIITIDNAKQVITSSENNDLYSGFNFNFVRLKRGVNYLEIYGACAFSITYEMYRVSGS